jgi:Kef-type K+ transport system membrane component KefB
MIGLILFMFVVGMELDLRMLRDRAHRRRRGERRQHHLPFMLGMGLAYYLYTRFAPPTIHLSPSRSSGHRHEHHRLSVLARIVQERGLSKTKLGSLAITCAAADDITAWCLLARSSPS